MTKLSPKDYQDAAGILRCEVSDVMTVAQVEARGDGFLLNGKPKILFERHKFRKYSQGKFDATHPWLSSKSPGGYKGGVAEWARYEDAAKLDPYAAKMAISMGKFQICGFNYALCGYQSVDQFFLAMHISEGEQLKAFCRFIINSHLDDDLREERYADFARGYNGANYKINEYDKKLAAADRKFEAAGVDGRQDDLGPQQEAQQLAVTNELEARSVAQSGLTEEPAIVPQAPQDVSTETKSETITTPLFSISWFKHRLFKAQDIVSQGQGVYNALPEAVRRPDTIKSFRVFLTVYLKGFLITLAGFYEHNKFIIAIGVAIFLVIAVVYLIRQMVLGAAVIKKQ